MDVRTAGSFLVGGAHSVWLPRHLQVLLDIGAGQGLFSLAAAVRGHRVIAMEASPRR